VKDDSPEDKCSLASVFLLSPSLAADKCMKMFTLGEALVELAKQYINITDATWLGRMTRTINFPLPCSTPSRDRSHEIKANDAIVQGESEGRNEPSSVSSCDGANMRQS
jgi:hypothetical protein